MIANLAGGRWVQPEVQTLPVYNPATGEVIEQVPLSGPAEVDEAAQAAAGAFEGWSRTPVMERVRLMFRFKAELEEHFEELAAIVTRHHGKTLDEARGEVRRGIEVVDFACGAPTLLQGRTLREVSAGVDQDLYRYPLGVCAGIPPFNFPVMIPLWMFPLAVVAGNTFILKPSERTPLGAVKLAELFLRAGFPEGVLNLVHGAKDAVEALLAHPAIRGVSFVGSAPVARHVYESAAANGKRVQALGGAKNHIVVMPDADLDAAVPAVLNSAFGNAGERCLAGSVAVAVGAASSRLMEPLKAATEKLVVGPGDQPGVQVGPLIRQEHRQKVLAYVERGQARAGPARVLPGPDRARQGLGRDGGGPGRDLRAGPLGLARGVSRRGDRPGQRHGAGQHGGDLHSERARGPGIPRARRHGHVRDQRAGGPAFRVLPVLRLERLFLRGPARARHGRDRLLHAQEGRGDTLVKGEAADGR